MLSAAEVMTRDVFTLPATLSLDGAIWALMHRGVSGAPVRDSAGNLVGVVSEGDLFEARGLPLGAEDDDDGSPIRAPEAGGVADVMTPVLVAVAPNDTTDEVIALMVAHAIRRVLVLDDTGRLVGIITPIDVLRALAEGRLHPTRELDSLADRFAPAP